MIHAQRHKFSRMINKPKSTFFLNEKMSAQSVRYYDLPYYPRRINPFTKLIATVHPFVRATGVHRKITPKSPPVIANKYRQVVKLDGLPQRFFIAMKITIHSFIKVPQNPHRAPSRP